MFIAAEGRKNLFRERNKILDGFLEDFSRAKFEQIYRCQKQNSFFLGKKKFLIEQACIESSIVIYCLRFKVSFAFLVKVAMFASKKWLNIRISVVLFTQLLRQTWDHKSTQIYLWKTTELDAIKKSLFVQ